MNSVQTLLNVGIFHYICEASTTIRCHCLRAKLTYAIFSFHACTFLQKPLPLCSQVFNIPALIKSSIGVAVKEHLNLLCLA